MKNKIFTTFLLITTIIALSACSKSAQTKLGIIDTIPDEYQVSKTTGIDVPPHFRLHNPHTDQQTSSSSAPLSEEEKKLIEAIN